MSLTQENRHVLQTPGAEQWQALLLIRFNMLRALDDLVQFKDEEILIPTILSGLKEVSGPATILKTTNLDVQRDYDRFIQHLILQSPLSVSEQYRAEALAMMDEIEATVQMDQTAILRLLERIEQVD